MSVTRLSRAQRNLANATPSGVTFLHGPVGAGKTTVGVQRALTLLDGKNIPPDALLIMVPQRALAAPYRDALRAHPKGAATPVMTFAGLAQRAIELFWPLVAANAGFANAADAPTFLSLETAQAAMHAAVDETIARERWFDTVTIPRNRLYAQVLTNLDKAAQLGLRHTDVGDVLARAWQGPELQRQVYAEAQAIADLFRAYCLAHNLLDYSLQVELFLRHVWPLPDCQGHLTSQYRHLIFDNVEEESPAVHGVQRGWLAACTSALVIYDEDAGVRSILGADPQSGAALRDLAAKVVRLDDARTADQDTHALAAAFAAVLGDAAAPDAATLARARAALTVSEHGFVTQAHLGVAEDVRRRIDAGTPPHEIVVLAPYLTDVPRYDIMSRLAELGVPARAHRPSRALREEPAARALLAWAVLAHPAWGLALAPEEVALALVESVEGMDWGRAMMLAARVVEGELLPPFEALNPAAQQRITFTLGQRWDGLRAWLEDTRAAPPAPLDVFWRRLFGEVLSQPGYAFRDLALDRARVTADLAEGAASFAAAASAWSADAARDYVVALRDGLLGALYTRDWLGDDHGGAVLVAPATTFLMRNRTARVQYWLDAGSLGWWERVYQPITHPYLLSLGWLERSRSQPDLPWTDLDEMAARRASLCALATGLVRRCTEQVVMVFSEVSSSGDDQRGPLLLAARRILSGRVGPTEADLAADTLADDFAPPSPTPQDDMTS